jgi:hypothetical protein
MHPPGDVLWGSVAGVVGDRRAAAFRRYLQDRVRPLTADEVLSSYPRHRPELQEWTRDGHLDLVRGSLLAVLKVLQQRQQYESARRPPAWSNLAAFLSDLPGDLHEEAEKFFRERDYTVPPRR